MAALGINPARVKLAAMMLSSFFAALGGTFYAQLVGYITPTRTMSVDFSVQMVVMAVLGGVGTVLGPLWGALVLVPIAETTRALWGGSLQGMHLIVYGALLMLVILYWPQGIDPWVRRGVEALARAWARGARRRCRPRRGERAAHRPARGRVARRRRWRPTGAARCSACAALSKSFGGAVGVREVSLEVAQGEVVGIIGANGAGKTTLFNLITGALAPDAGEIWFGGHRLGGEMPDERNRLGIARTFQIVRPFIGMTALDNVVVAALPRVADVGRGQARGRAVPRLRRPRPSARIRPRAASAPGSASGSSWPGPSPRARACSCSTRSRAVSTSAACPDSSASIKKVKAEGLTLLVIEHNLRMVTAVADRLVMLHLGQKIQDGDPAAVVNDPAVIDIYVGGGVHVRALRGSRSATAATSRSPTCRSGWSAGEIVCLMGANGSGKSSLMNAVSGLVTPAAGSVRFDGDDITQRPHLPAARRGLAHVLERRRLFPYMTVQENLLLGAYVPALRAGPGGDARARASPCSRRCATRQSQLAHTLSGGEQQMVAIGRALMSRPRFIMLDEPFLGLAPRLVLQVAETMRRINAEGVTVLFTEQAIQQSLAIVASGVHSRERPARAVGDERRACWPTSSCSGSTWDSTRRASLGTIRHEPRC